MKYKEIFFSSERFEQPTYNFIISINVYYILWYSSTWWSIEWTKFQLLWKNNVMIINYHEIMIVHAYLTAARDVIERQIGWYWSLKPNSKWSNLINTIANSR